MKKTPAAGFTGPEMGRPIQWLPAHSPPTNRPPGVSRGMTIWGQPPHFRSLALKNRVIRASRPCPGGAESGWRSLDWELEYARAGVGAVISARAEVCPGAGSALDALSLQGEEALARWQQHVGRIHAY